LRTKKLSEINSKIKKQILKFADLNETQRKEVRKMMHEAMQLGEEIQAGVKK
jgi:F0F1-type ATP synthase assembly protein I